VLFACRCRPAAAARTQRSLCVDVALTPEAQDRERGMRIEGRSECPRTLRANAEPQKLLRANASHKTCSCSCARPRLRHSPRRPRPTQCRPLQAPPRPHPAPQFGPLPRAVSVLRTACQAAARFELSLQVAQPCLPRARRNNATPRCYAATAARLQVRRCCCPPGAARRRQELAGFVEKTHRARAVRRLEVWRRRGWSRAGSSATQP
jgi:hypothetical protein